MQRPFPGVRSGVVEKVRDVERVVPVEGRIRVGGARARGDSFLLFFCCFVLTAEFASVGKREAGLQRRGQSDLRIVLMARAWMEKVRFW